MGTRGAMLKSLNIVLQIVVAAAGITMLVTQRFEYMIYYILLLGGSLVITSIRDIRKKEDEFGTYMNITVFLLLFLLYIFIFVIN